jgi:hypothetical protein
MARRPKEPTPLHERYNSAHPLLRELVLVNVKGNDGESFDALLTRVPGLGEEINREDRSYRVVRVWHQPVNDDGRAPWGWHAMVDAEMCPDDGDAFPHVKLRKPALRKTSRKRKKHPPKRVLKNS